MKRLFAVVVAVGLFATYASSPALGQRAPEAPERRAPFIHEVKAHVKQDFEGHPKDRVLCELHDGSKVVGRIHEIHDEDFVVDFDHNHLQRTIAYADLVRAPGRVTPLAENVALYTGLGVIFIALLPFIMLAAALGWDC